MSGTQESSALDPSLADLLRRDAAVIAGVEKLRFSPLAVSGGKGSYLFEAGGRRLLDLSASWTAAGLGYGHPAVVAAVTSEMSSPGGASGLSSISATAVRFAERLADSVPTDSDDGRRVYLGNTGTDANDVALRACRRATGRARIVAFQGGYHGGLGLAMEVSHVFVAGGLPPNDDVTFLPYPDPLRPHTGDPATVLSDVEALLGRELARGDVACVIVEPIQSDGGLIVPPDGFLRMLTSVCRANEVPLIIDEVKVGLGRTGFLHACEYDGVAPDLITFGKSLGGGLPLSAVVGPSWILDSGTASSLLTSAGNPVCAAAGHAVLDVIAGEGLATRARALGDRMQEALAVGVQRRGLDDRVGSVRGRGLTMGVDLVRDGNVATPDPALARKVVYRAWQLGAVVFYVGGNVLEITPPLTLSDDECRDGVEILLTAIAEADQVTEDEVAPFAGW